jgi:hypothetical protein
MTDSAPDSALAGQPLLYTTGGILENRSPPSARLITVHKDRVFLGGTDDPKVIWYSQPYIFGGPQPGFHEQLSMVVEEGGALTAFASLDEKLVLFKRDRIFVVFGEGPPRSGGVGNEFSSPQRISSDLGCIEPNSAAVVPQGCVFQTTAGIYLLNRKLEVQYLSGPVEDELEAFPVITSAVVHESEFQVRFTCNAADGGSGVVLVWDYLANEWSVFRLGEAVAASASSAIADAVNVRGVYTWIAPNGAGYAESATAYTDAGTWITLQVETSWYQMGGLQGFQRAFTVMFLGERYTSHDLLLETAYDYAATYADTKLWRSDKLDTLPLEQVEQGIRQPKHTAIKFRITDATPTGQGAVVGTGRSLSLSGLLLEVNPLPRRRPVNGVQRS